MKKQIISTVLLLIFSLLFAGQDMTFAQDSTVTVTKTRTTYWLSENWLWVAGGALLVIIIIAAASGKRKTTTSTTTVVKDDLGNTRRVTTSETTD